MKSIGIALVKGLLGKGPLAASKGIRKEACQLRAPTLVLKTTSLIIGLHIHDFS